MISILIMILMEKCMFKQFDLRFIFQSLTFGAVSQRFNDRRQEKKSTAIRGTFIILLLSSIVSHRTIFFIYI